MPDFLSLALVRHVGGPVNAKAGGLKRFVFTLLQDLGLTPVVVNATSTLSLWLAPVSVIIALTGLRLSVVFLFRS